MIGDWDWGLGSEIKGLGPSALDPFTLAEFSIKVSIPSQAIDDWSHMHWLLHYGVSSTKGVKMQSFSPICTGHSLSF